MSVVPGGAGCGTAARWLTCQHGNASLSGGVRRRRVPDRAVLEHLGFARFYQLPAGGDGEPGYVGLRRGASELAVVASAWARDQYGLTPGDGPRFEMFVYTDDVDRLITELRAEGVPILRDPADMPWGERVAAVADPDGNPVSLASEPSPSS